MQYLIINIAIFLYAITGILGKLVSAPSSAIVFSRLVLSVVGQGIILACKLDGENRAALPNKKDFFLCAIAGFILLIHNLSFFESVNISGVTVAVYGFCTYPLIVALLEPLIYREKFASKMIIAALFSFTGVGLVIPISYNSNWNTSLIGGSLGILSGLSYAGIILINRYLIKKNSAAIIALCEAFIASILVAPFINFLDYYTLSYQSYILLIILGLGATTIADFLYIKSLSKLTGIVASLLGSLESIYALILSFLFLGDSISLREISGGLIVVLSVLFGTGAFDNKWRKNQLLA